MKELSRRYIPKHLEEEFDRIAEEWRKTNKKCRFEKFFLKKASKEAIKFFSKSEKEY